MNTNLNKAKTNKNDEFYTLFVDIENEMSHYISYFSDKIVYHNCDDPEKSNFWRYFHLNFSKLKLKKLIATHYIKFDNSYKMTYDGGCDEDISAGNKTPLDGKGDFRSQECLNILKQSDIIITNPPFSIFREYLLCILNYDKKFIILGDKTSVINNNLFKYIKNDVIRLGYEKPSKFETPDGIKYLPNKTRWYTNLPTYKVDSLNLTCSVNDKKFDRYDYIPSVINIDNLSDIPYDYDGIMGVPITYLDKHDPSKFEIIDAIKRYPILKNISVPKGVFSSDVNGVSKFTRIFIRRIKS